MLPLMTRIVPAITSENQIFVCDAWAVNMVLMTARDCYDIHDQVSNFRFGGRCLKYSFKEDQSVIAGSCQLRP